MVSVPRATLFAEIVVVRLILPVPSKLTPEAVTSPARAIVRPVAKAVAVSASATAISAVPSKLVPPIVLAVSNAVAVAAFPLVSWLPVVFTPAKSMFAVPSKETPPIVLAVANAVAVSATTPVKSLIKVLVTLASISLFALAVV